MKVTILGDIMCEPRLLKAAKTGNGQYDFLGVFENVRGMLSESDYVIGNLETPLAGESEGYVSSLFQFNAPDSFALAAKEAGIDLLLTANNHCLDRGLSGLKRTVKVLEKNQIPCAGTFLEPERRGNTYFRIGTTRFAVIAYTYGTNYSDNHILLSEDEKDYINLLRPQTEPYYIHRPQNSSLRKRVMSKIANSFHGDTKFRARKYLGLPVNTARSDDNLRLDTLGEYLQTLNQDIDTAKQNADIVLFCPHIGGQFNKEPGEFSKYIFSAAAEKGVHAIVASHSHVVQPAEWKGSVPCYYSLGNFSMSPNSIYLLHENLPDYGIAAHLYIDGNKIVKASFSILKIVEEHMLTVYPVDEYASSCHMKEKNRLEEEIEQIYRTVCSKPLTGSIIRREYSLSE